MLPWQHYVLILQLVKTCHLIDPMLILYLHYTADGNTDRRAYSWSGFLFIRMWSVNKLDGNTANVFNQSIHQYEKQDTILLLYKACHSKKTAQQRHRLPHLKHTTYYNMLFTCTKLTFGSLSQFNCPIFKQQSSVETVKVIIINHSLLAS